MTRLFRWVVPFAVLLGLVVPLAAGPVPASAATKSVNAWVDLSATRPGVGCALDVSFEIRSSGAPVAGAQVELALHNDDGLISLDREVTNSDGITYLELSTSDAIAGVGYWLDINVGGEYLKGLSIVPTADGGCSDGHKLLEYDGDINYVPASSESDAGSGTEIKVSVPRYAQQRPLSCEYAALHIATSAFGDGVSEYAFDDWVGWSPNPHLGYRGDINGTWGNTTDYGVYAEPLSWALDDFGYRGEVFYGQGDASQLKASLDQGKPTLVWLGLWGDESIYDTLNGSRYKVVAGMHVMVAYGYDSDGLYLSDPGTGTYRFYSWGDFMWMWNILDGMALAVSPY